MNKNKSLFWYGFRARLKKVFGIFIAAVGLVLSLLFNIWAGVIVIILGIILFFSGASGEYDYKRQGGYIVYND